MVRPCAEVLKQRQELVRRGGEEDDRVPCGGGVKWGNSIMRLGRG